MPGAVVANGIRQRIRGSGCCGRKDVRGRR
nr:MAG TPA: hypothetical protein [Caudoviricetes sp.]